MQPLTVEDLKPLDAYEQTREAVRRWTIGLKRSRRITVGQYITLVFENRDTLWFQIQEMIRAERIIDPKKLQDEVETYNELIPAAGELSATLLIEVTEASRMKEILDSLQGIDRGQTVWLRVGPRMIYGSFESGHSKENRISAVHFVRFHVPESIKTELRNLQTRIDIGITHPSYHAVVPVPDDMRFALLNDLA
jgi:hypothetical protein